MHYYTAFGLHISSEIELPELAGAAEKSQPDLQIRKASIDLPELSPTQIYRRGIQAGFGQNAAGELFLDWSGVGKFSAKGGKMLAISPATDDTNLLSLFTISEALGLVLFQRGLFLLHASAVKVGDEAWCFMGAPGAGKSSTAAAFVKAGCPLLGDDLTAITFDAAGLPQVIPSYPQLKLWEKTVDGLSYNRESLQPVSEGVNKFSYGEKAGFPDKPVRLGKVFFLHHQAGQPGERVMPAAEVPSEMLKNFPLPAELLTPDTLKRHFIQSLACAEHATILRKKRPEGFAELERWVKEVLSSQMVKA